MSPETVAAIWGGISGALFGTLGSAVVLLLNRWLRGRGGLECKVRSWRMSWLQYLTPGVSFHGQPPGIVEKPTYRRFRHHVPEDDFTNYAEYVLTVELVNETDIETQLRDLEVAFLKGGAELFAHRPFDAGEAPDISGVSDEDHREFEVDTTHGYSTHIPDSTLSPVSTVHLPTRTPVVITLKGYIRDRTLNYTKAGYDEVRLRGTWWGGKRLDEPIPDSGYYPDA